jgi:hypothetical protein
MLAQSTGALTLTETMPECTSPLVYEPFSLAPLTLTHVCVALALIIVVSERAQLRRAAILGSTYATIMVWYALRRLTTMGRRRVAIKAAQKERYLLTS